jgi:hypothetical protein
MGTQLSIDAIVQLRAARQWHDLQRIERSMVQAELNRQNSLPGALETARRAAERDVEMVTRGVKASLRLLAADIEADHQARVHAHWLRPRSTVDPAKQPRVLAIGGQQWP